MTDEAAPRNPDNSNRPDVFILESLNQADEEDGQHEGAVLAEVLRFCGKNPEYRYFRTEKELRHFSEEFRDSHYRFLHLSCHGDDTGLQLRFDDISFDTFAEIFEGKLKNRRLFLSACQGGQKELVKQVGSRNRGMYSILAPKDKIHCDHAVAIWAAFYVKLFDVDKRYAKNVTITKTIRSLCNLFGVAFSWSYHDTVADRWRHYGIAPPKRPSHAPRLLGSPETLGPPVSRALEYEKPLLSEESSTLPDEQQ